MRTCLSPLHPVWACSLISDHVLHVQAHSTAVGVSPCHTQIGSHSQSLLIIIDHAGKDLENTFRCFQNHWFWGKASKVHALLARLQGGLRLTELMAAGVHPRGDPPAGPQSLCWTLGAS